MYITSKGNDEVNNELKKMLKKVNLEQVVAYLLYDTDAENKNEEIYENKVENSYNTFFECIEKVYPFVNRNEGKLWDAVTEFASVHDEVYFEFGIIVGFRLYKNLEQGFKKLYSESKEKSFTNMRKKYDDLFKEFFSQRMEKALEESIRTDEKYNEARKIANMEQDKLNKIVLDKAQWQLMDNAISAANALGAEYGRAAYYQGFQDAIKLVSELYNMV